LLLNTSNIVNFLWALFFSNYTIFTSKKKLYPLNTIDK